MRMLFGCWLCVTLALPAMAQERLTSPYVDERSTEIRGFTGKEIQDLRDGAGMGLARAAELNSYPGPRHLLDAVQQGRFETRGDQLKRLTEIFEGMKREAQRIGAAILGEEARLEAAFRSGAMTDGELRSRVSRIAQLQGELRSAHLAAHLATRAILTEQQIEEYNKLRGYTPNTSDDGSPHQHRH
jgi:hypothetical protein